MQTFKQVRDFMRGKKTILTGILMVALGLLQNEPDVILQGIGLITFRAALTK